ncbi:hypothetical protein Poli38472_006590 [Pythium oligandrum]|uniref:Mitochondrial splicing suppressor 51-like C-terminal domain-containing protein n=1 Tax=Pythium oligandrum TaxID=41045 RepID=A0A8K1FAU4_PYTOL|nr:hypothetical protein Poli38472_006590 [Pythium oligandrum]|eukprot:TMW56580.1 hypothetical protein Poli38472_006590 [Pythium oligandrum]
MTVLTESRALTLIECVKRLKADDYSESTGLSSVDAKNGAPSVSNLLTLPVDGTLTIHLVGADHREGNTVAETLGIFDQFFQYLAVDDRCYETLQLVLVGPNIAHKLHNDSHESTHIDTTATLEAKATAAAIQIELSYYVGSFDDYYGETDQYVRPDLAVCFNAGIWGYDQWLPTLRLLVHQIQTPLLITSYNENEASDDEDVLDDSVAPPRWFWRAEKNPFGSLTHRSTRNEYGSILRENDFWMCVGPSSMQSVVVSE